MSKIGEHLESERPHEEDRIPRPVHDGRPFRLFTFTDEYVFTRIFRAVFVALADKLPPAMRRSVRRIRELLEGREKESKVTVVSVPVSSISRRRGGLFVLAHRDKRRTSRSLSRAILGIYPAARKPRRLNFCRGEEAKGPIFTGIATRLFGKLRLSVDLSRCGRGGRKLSK